MILEVIADISSVLEAGWIELLDQSPLQRALSLSGLSVVLIGTYKFIVWPFRTRSKNQKTKVEGLRKAIDTKRAEKASSERAALITDLENVKQLLGSLVSERTTAELNTKVDLDEAVDTIIEEGNPIEIEALSLLALGSIREASNIFDDFIHKSGPKAVESLRRKGALFSPIDTFVAKDAYQRLLAVHPNDVDARIQLGSLLERLGEFEAARLAYQQVADLSVNDPVWHAIALCSLGSIAQSLGNLDEAINLYERALQRYQQMDDQRIVYGAHLKSNVLSNLGLIERDHGHYEKAKDLLEDCLALGRATEDLEGIATALGNLGLVAMDMGDLDAAHSYFSEAHQIAVKLGNRLFSAIALGNLGNVASRQSNFVSAKQYYQDSLDISQELGNRVGIAAQTGNVGTVEMELRNWSSAQALFEKSLDLECSLGNKKGEAIQLGNLGNVSMRLGYLEKADSYFSQSLDLYSKLDHTLGIATQCGNLGLLAYNTGNLSIAAERLDRSLSIYRSLNVEAPEVILSARSEIQ